MKMNYYIVLFVHNNVSQPSYGIQKYHIFIMLQYIGRVFPSIVSFTHDDVSRHYISYYLLFMQRG